MEENFYVRGDGTRVYFFEQEELEYIWGGPQAENEDKKEKRVNKAVDGQLAAQVENVALDSSTQEPKSFDPRGSDSEPVPSFDIVHFGVDRRMLVNRQRRLKMYRCWMQAVFRKDAAASGSATEVATSTLRQDQKEADGSEEES
jgi:tRNAThr (cytosine32-N3)-methyltransferase